MAIKYWTIEQIKESFEVNDEFVAELESEKIIVSERHPRKPVRVFCESEIEKVRLAAMLVREMGVNLAGVEVILHMRSNMLEMRRQMDRILEHVAREVRKSLNEME